MGTPHIGGTTEEPAPALVRAELDRILASELFARSERLSAFLKFIVEQSLSGQRHTLKEQVIAIELYGKGADFNTAADPIVRVDARRLRDRLREYYASAPAGPVTISVPKGSYTPVFARKARAPLTVPDRGRPVQEADSDEVHSPVETAAEGSRSDRRSPRLLWVFIGGVAVLVLVVVMLAASRRGPDAAPMRLLTVTSLPGSEEDPSLSPDGSFVAFSWKRVEPSSTADIWVKAIDGDAMRQLTATPNSFEKYPSWTPDGQHITFTRIERDMSRVFMVSSLGGPERMIAEGTSEPEWLPDGQSLVMVERSTGGAWGLVHHVLATGARRRLFEAPAGLAVGKPRISPDGKTVAFQIYGQGRSAIYTMPLRGGAATLFGTWYSGLMGGLSWSPDGREILFVRPELSGRRLMRVVAASSDPPMPIPVVPHGAVNPSVSHPSTGGRYRLAFSSGQPDVGLRMIDLQGPRAARMITAVVPFCDATRMDTAGRFSPDASQVAFVSDRGGSQQVWVAGRDGSALRSVTTMQDATMSVGSWSPDGQWIAFDGTVTGNSDIYAVRVDGGAIKRLTTSTAAQIDPEWSHDGRSIYFSSNESGSSTIWKIPASGGTPVRLSSEQGFDPRESPDGRTIYFLDRVRWFGFGAPGMLKQMSTAGGAASPVDISVAPGAWDVTDKGIVFVMTRPGVLDPSPAPDVVAVYDFADHRVRPLGELNFRIAPFGTSRFLIASRDGRWALAAHVDRWDRDIMVLDNFR